MRNDTQANLEHFIHYQLWYVNQQIELLMRQRDQLEELLNPPH